MLGDRFILHIGVDTFHVSIERRNNPDLVGKPIVVIGNSNYSPVLSTSIEAARFGVRVGMPARIARDKCKFATFIQGDLEYYHQQSAIITEIVNDKAPLFEKETIDAHYVDLTGMDKYIGCSKWVHNFRQGLIKETGLPISCALASNKLVAKIGTGEARPNREIQIVNGTEKLYIAPLSVRKIPSLHYNTYTHLEDLGVKKIEILQQIPTLLLVEEFGKTAIQLQEKANAVDKSLVVPYSAAEAISDEHLFEKDTTEIKELYGVVVKLIERLGFALRQKGKLAGCLTIKIRFADGNTDSKQKHIPYTAKDEDLIVVGKPLFKSLYSKRIRIRLIGVKLTNLIYGSTQINLFDDTATSIRLYKAMDLIKNKHGIRAVLRASGI